MKVVKKMVKEGIRTEFIGFSSNITKEGREGMKKTHQSNRKTYSRQHLLRTGILLIRNSLELASALYHDGKIESAKRSYEMARDRADMLYMLGIISRDKANVLEKIITETYLEIKKGKRVVGKPKIIN